MDVFPNLLMILTAALIYYFDRGGNFSTLHPKYFMHMYRQGFGDCAFSGSEETKKQSFTPHLTRGASDTGLVTSWYDWWHCGFPSRWGGKGLLIRASPSLQSWSSQTKPIILLLKAIGTFDRKYLPPLNFTSKQSSSQESIEQKLKEAEVRKKSIETERLDWKTFMTKKQIFSSYNVIILFSG